MGEMQERPRLDPEGEYEEGAVRAGAGTSQATREPSLAQRADAAEQALVEYAESEYVTEKGLELLGAARAALTDTPPDEVAARTTMVELECLIERARESDVHGPRLTRTIVWCTAGWFVLLVTVAFFGAHPDSWLESSVGGDLWRALILSSVAGGIGGITQTFFGLRKHLVQRTFDPAKKLGYLVKPLMGMIMGPVVALVLLSGVLVFGDSGGGLLTTAEGEGAPARAALILILGFLAGYSERFWTQLLDQVLDVLLRRERQSGDSP